jgi:hypothetical protein
LQGNRNGQIYNYCYYFVKDDYSFANAVDICARQLGTGLVQPKNNAGLNDLYPLYKSHDNFYFWVSCYSNIYMSYRVSSSVNPRFLCLGWLVFNVKMRFPEFQTFLPWATTEDSLFLTLHLYKKRDIYKHNFFFIIFFS